MYPLAAFAKCVTWFGYLDTLLRTWVAFWRAGIITDYFHPKCFIRQTVEKDKQHAGSGMPGPASFMKEFAKGYTKGQDPDTDSYKLYQPCKDKTSQATSSVMSHC